MKLSNGKRSIPAAKLYRISLERAVSEALREDLLPAAGTTSDSGTPLRGLWKNDPSAAAVTGVRGRSVVLMKSAGVLSGVSVIAETFRQLGGGVRVTTLFSDGDVVAPGDIIAKLEGPASVLLAGERTALNFLQQLSGVATATQAMVQALGARAQARIYDTRKTMPGLRVLQKAAVVHGGGNNHRMNLTDMAMVKNNHVDAAGSVLTAIEGVRRVMRRGAELPLCVEARTREEAVDAAAAGAAIVMLDNFPISSIRSAVAAIAKAAREAKVAMPQIEVSGGITIEKIAKYRKLPIDRISIGAITHSAKALDISMRTNIEVPKGRR